AVRRLLARDVDADELFRGSRLASAPEPVESYETSTDEAHMYYWKLAGAAERAAAEGTSVWAAILRTRAARGAPGGYTTSTRERADADLRQLVRRLQAALQLNDDEAAAWLKVLPPLLDKADQGARPVEAALLFELQKVCLDHERDSYALDVVEWLLSGGNRP